MKLKVGRAFQKRQRQQVEFLGARIDFSMPCVAAMDGEVFSQNAKKQPHW
jgi:hypothetical protein